MASNNSSRTINTLKNILWGNVGNVLTSLLSFVSRTVFISTLGATYLGVNGLFSDILGVLSFAELGIGNAMNYSLYKPIAENDEEKIKSLMQLFRRAYWLIALTITVMGLLILPFLEFFVSAEAQFDHLRVYYLIFLFNSVTSYLTSYKYAYVNAQQKEYILSNFNTVFSILLTLIQMAVLLVFRNFMVYLLVQSFWGLVQKLVTVFYINKKYPVLVAKNIKKLSFDDSKIIFADIKALVIHKIGDVAVHQTDNIIISAFISTTSVGLISNYKTLHLVISKFSNTIFNSFIAGLGNLIAKESVEKQRKIFELYNFLGSWIFGFVAVSFITLADPFVALWLGEQMVLDTMTMVLFFLSLYFASQTLAIYNFKIAAGIFNDDKYVAFAQAIVNLVTSIFFVKLIGLPGVFLGTIIQRMIVVVFRPYVVYKKHFKQGLGSYYFYYVKDSVVMLATCYVLYEVKKIFFYECDWAGFFILMIISVLFSNLIFILFNIRRMHNIGVHEYIRRLIESKR